MYLPKSSGNTGLSPCNTTPANSAPFDSCHQGSDLNGVMPTNTTSTGDVTKWTYDGASGLLTAKTYADGKGPQYTYTADGLTHTRSFPATA